MKRHCFRKCSMKGIRAIVHCFSFYLYIYIYIYIYRYTSVQHSIMDTCFTIVYPKTSEICSTILIMNCLFKSISLF